MRQTQSVFAFAIHCTNLADKSQLSIVPSKLNLIISLINAKLNMFAMTAFGKVLLGLVLLLVGGTVLDVDGAACDSVCGYGNAIEEDREVIILGAGMAGTKAAHHLHENGVTDTLILEANDYIGGRMKKTTFGSTTNPVVVELGANWFEGSGSNPALDIGNLAGIDYDRQIWNDWDTYLNSGVGDVTSIANNKVKKARNDARAAFSNCLSGLAAAYDPNDPNSVDIGFAQALKDTCSWDPFVTDPDPLRQEVDWFSCNYAFPGDRDGVSLINGKSPIYCPYNCAQYYLVYDQTTGIAGVADYLVNDYNLNVQLNAKVECVDWENAPVKIYTDDCKVYTADIVISTLSVGALTQDPGIFDPSFASVKDVTKNPFTFGLYYKIFYQFPTKFWGNEEFINIVNENGPPGYCGLFQNLDISYFVPGSKTLFCTMTTEVIETVEDVNGDIPYSTIEEFVRPVFDAFNVPQNERTFDYLYYNWKNDPTTFGSYAYWKKGAKIADHTDFFAPLTTTSNNVDTAKVAFAGAASCGDERLQGAHDSGVHAANVAMDALGYSVTMDTLCDLATILA